jgi:hypothetical protein
VLVNLAAVTLQHLSGPAVKTETVVRTVRD